MGYGLGVVLIVLGLVLVYALEFTIPGVGKDTLGWILVAAGAAVMLITFLQLNARRRASTVARTTHPDGSQTVQERDSDLG